MPHPMGGLRWTGCRLTCASGDHGVWRSLVARVVRDDEAAGSNPVTPTKLSHADRVHHTVAETYIFFSVYLLFGLFFFLFGLYMVRNSEKTARFFNGLGSSLYGKKMADRVYKARNLLWAAWGFVILGPVAIAQAVYMIVHTIVTGRPPS